MLFPHIVRNCSVRFLCIFSLLILNASCNKYLDKKPRQDLATPATLADLQAILDNQSYSTSASAYAEFVADNFYQPNSVANSQTIQDRLQYIWNRDAITQDAVWIEPYFAIYYANFVLDYWSKVSHKGYEKDAGAIKGAALFYRAYLFHQLAQLFCKPYTATAATDPGIVLRLTAALEPVSVRATVEQTYTQIVTDLKAAADLLPVKTSYSTRPDKATVYATLARVYLSMRDYVNAGLYADKCLDLRAALLDFNDLSNGALPVLQNNPEVLFVAAGRGSDLFDPSRCIIDSTLLRAYQINDLRKTVFFGQQAGTWYWKGTYVPNFFDVTYSVFNGIAVDEMYLIRAECRARAGNKDDAMLALNTLLKKRWKAGTFSDLTAVSPANALDQILAERRKELPFRNLRWSDLRRLNLEGADITLKRVVDNTVYTLPPNDLRWVLPIPDVEISRSGIPQNPR